METVQVTWPQRKPVKKFCAVTMARDEESHLATWLSHYGRELPNCHFVIIDHASQRPVKDFIADEFPLASVDVIRLPEFPFDDITKSSSLSSISAIMLSSYETVIATDSDELVISLNSEANIGDILLSLEDGFTAPLGMEFVHHTSKEGPFDFRRPLLDQRTHFFFASAFSKPVIWKRKATRFTPGQHRVVSDYRFDARLGLAHLRMVDVKTSLRRQTSRNALVDALGDIKAWNGKPGAGWLGDFIFRKLTASVLKDRQSETQSFFHRIEKSKTESGQHAININSEFCAF